MLDFLVSGNKNFHEGKQTAVSQEPAAATKQAKALNEPIFRQHAGVRAADGPGVKIGFLFCKGGRLQGCEAKCEAKGGMRKASATGMRWHVERSSEKGSQILETATTVLFNKSSKETEQLGS